jgi:glycosyltransferase involved in cell wall biosynthesis
MSKIEAPFVSILMPTYNRRNFLPLIMCNIFNQTYPKDKLELVIFDDHKSPLFVNDGEVKNVSKHIGIPINYHRDISRHLGIGEKRNKLVKLAKYKYMINMDDDDIYLPSYIEYSMSILVKNKCGLVGSPQMLFVFPYEDWKMTGIECETKRQIHEATMCFTKKHFNSMGGFVKKGNGEGSKLVDWNDKKCMKTDVNKCMICIAHKNNTVDKNMFLDKDAGKMKLSPELIKLIAECLGLPEPSVFSRQGFV